MAFPQSPIFDAFNRADENPLLGGGIWNAAVDNGTAAQLISNAAGTSGVAKSSKTTASFGPDVDVYFTVGAKPANGLSLAIKARIQDGGTATPDYYHVQFVTQAGSDTIGLYRVDNGAFTNLGGLQSQEYAVGDCLGLRCAGSAITVYFKPAAGAWAQVLSVTDATYSAAGPVGLGAEGAGRLDDFGAGTIALTSAAASGGSDDAYYWS